MNLFRIPFSSHRIYGLDILRAFAILFVVYGHGIYFVPEKFRPAYSFFIADGVSIFFVLSGFLIGGILIRLLESKPAHPTVLLDFWIKRWVRTVPPYFLVLTVVCLLSLVRVVYVNREFSPQVVWKFYLFLQNLATPNPYFYPEAWSLAVEEWFYLLIPPAVFALAALRLKPARAVALVATLVLLLVTTYRFYKFQQLAPSTEQLLDEQFRKVVFTRLDSIMYGVLGAYWACYFPASWIKGKQEKLVLGIAILLAQQFLPPSVAGLGVYTSVFSFSLSSLATMLMLPAANSFQAPDRSNKWKVSLYRTLTHISLISYSMYLLNATVIIFYLIDIPFQILGIGGTKLFSVLGYASLWILTVGLSTLMYKYFELPVMGLRRHIKLTLPDMRKDLVH